MLNKNMSSLVSNTLLKLLCPQHAAVSLVHNHQMFYYLLGANTAKKKIRLQQQLGVMPPLRFLRIRNVIKTT